MLTWSLRHGYRWQRFFTCCRGTMKRSATCTRSAYTHLPKDPKVIYKYHRVCALMYASSGNAQMASDSFAKALHYAEQDPDPYAYTSILHSHAMSASMLGRTELAATLFLQALSAARDRNLGWNVACIWLEYARVLSRRGNRHLAHAYVDQAATVESPPPVLLEALAEIRNSDRHRVQRPVSSQPMRERGCSDIRVSVGRTAAPRTRRIFIRPLLPSNESAAQSSRAAHKSSRVCEERRSGLRFAACGRAVWRQ